MTETLRSAIEAAYDGTNSNAPSPEQEPEITSTQEEETPEGGGSPSMSEPEIEAPTHWASDDREVFKSLDKRGREFLLRRHKEMESSHTKKMQDHAEKIKRADHFTKIIEPHEAYIKQVGFDPMEAVEKLINAEMKLRMGSSEEKAKILQNLAKQYGIQYFANQNNDTQADEKTQFILQKIQETENSVRQIKHEKEQAENRALTKHVLDWAAQTDGKGLPKYPHFETVRSKMGMLMANGEAENLDEAYDSAILLNKDLRNEYILRQNGANDAGKKKPVSKDASFNVKSDSTSKMSEPPKKESLRETIARALDTQNNKRI